jgi:hypothetical protein
VGRRSERVELPLQKEACAFLDRGSGGVGMSLLVWRFAPKTSLAVPFDRTATGGPALAAIFAAELETCSYRPGRHALRSV